MLIKVIEIILFVITLFLLWLSCYPHYVAIWGKGILRLTSGKRRDNNEKK